MSKIQIIKGGSVQGWFVSFMITIITLVAFIGSMLFDTVCDRFAKIGSAWATIVIGQFTAWLAFRAYTGKTEREETKNLGEVNSSNR